MRRHGIGLANGVRPLGIDVVEGDHVYQLAVEPEHSVRRRLAQPHRIRGDRIEHGLRVRLRPGDDPEHLGRRGLLLERHGQVPVARLQFLEQADVLDGDDGLGGEGLEQLHLIVREGGDVRPRHGDRPDRVAFAEHRHGQDAPDTHGRHQTMKLVLGILTRVGDIHRVPRQDRARGRTAATRGVQGTSGGRILPPRG